MIHCSATSRCSPYCKSSVDEKGEPRPEGCRPPPPDPPPRWVDSIFRHISHTEGRARVRTALSAAPCAPPRTIEGRPEGRGSGAYGEARERTDDDAAGVSRLLGTGGGGGGAVFGQTSHSPHAACPHVNLLGGWGRDTVTRVVCGATSKPFAYSFWAGAHSLHQDSHPRWQ